MTESRIYKWSSFIIDLLPSDFPAWRINILEKTRVERAAQGMITEMGKYRDTSNKCGLFSHLYGRSEASSS